MNLPAPSPLWGWAQPSTGDPKSPERRALDLAQQLGRGDEAGTRFARGFGTLFLYACMRSA
jgi:hypothetical protein